MTALQKVRTALVLGIGGALMIVTPPAAAQAAAPAPVVALQPQPPSTNPTPTRFLKVDGVTGESTDPAHLGWIAISSFQWGVTNTGNTGAGDRATARAQRGPSSFTFTKTPDKTSVTLQKAAIDGHHIKSVLLELVSRTKGEYYQATMSDVVVANYHTGSAGDRPTESMTLNFAKVEIKYGKVDAQGNRGPLQAAPPTWDIRQIVAS